MSEAMERLGVDPRGPSRRYLAERMRKLGISTAHFEREGARWTRERLAPVVAASTSLSEVLRRLGVDAVGGQHAHIGRRVKTLGIDTSHFAPPSRMGRKLRRTPADLLVNQTSPHAHRVPGDRLKQAMRSVGRLTEERCALCGTGPVWLGRPLPLEVDHLDGDWRNNRIGNLRLLCPNCHSTTDTYRGRGKGQRGAAPARSAGRGH
jgi:hypothetical protein